MLLVAMSEKICKVGVTKLESEQNKIVHTGD